MPEPSPEAKKWATATAIEVEAIAREEAAKRGFDIAKESHGLFRAMCHVLSNKDLLTLAARRAKQKLEAQEHG
jgi:hypothetical protein